MKFPLYFESDEKPVKSFKDTNSMLKSVSDKSLWILDTHLRTKETSLMAVAEVRFCGFDA